MRILLAAAALLTATQCLAAFSFSEEEEKAKKAEAPRVASPVSKACRESLARKRVVVVIGERAGGGVRADQSAYGGMFQIINERLQARGLRTYTQAEIKKQIAQAEVDAYFRNDPDAALAASRKLGADHVLRGLIVAQRGVNPVLNINEVAINMSFTLADSGGRSLASASAKADSYAGADVLGMAQTLVREQADGVVEQLIAGLCKKSAGKPAGD